jgi:outer membrane protein assembly factor BamB
MTRLLPIASFALVVCVALQARAGDWTQFRGPGGTAVSDEKDLPVTWSDMEGLRWKADLPGRGLSNPVISGGKVFLTANSGFQNCRLHVLAFDAATGKKLWERQFAATGDTSCHPKTCMAANTPATDGKHVFALFGTGDLAALDYDGNLLWYRSLVSDYPTVTNQVGMAASPVVYKDTLLLPLENVGESFAAGLDTRTGRNRWKVERRRDINWVTPLVRTDGNRAEVLFQTNKELTSYDVETGKTNWSFGGTGEALSEVSSPLSGGGLLFVPGKELTALKPAPGSATPGPVWRAKVQLGFTSAVYHDDRLYGLTQTGVTCLNAKTGEQLWKQRADGPFSASPVVADGKLYAVSEDGKTTVIKLGDKPEVLAVNRVGETILATPAISGGAIFLRSDKHLYCVGKPK